MTLFLQMLAAAQALVKIVNDPETAALLAKLAEWFKSLPAWQQLAFASQFEPFKGYGCANCDDADCPVPPEDVQPIVAAFIEAAKAA